MNSVRKMKKSVLEMINHVKTPAGVIAIMMAVLLAPIHAVRAEDNQASPALPKVRFVTTAGPFELQLRPDVAPKTVANFLEYVRDGFYDGTVFHRVIPGFMIQGGGFTPDLTRKNTRPPIENEATASLPNLRGTISMARTSNPDSATSQFFINVVDNHFLNEGVRGPGYAVFGKVTDGMGVVDAISRVDTGYARGMQDVPVEPVVIERATLVGDSE